MHGDEAIWREMVTNKGGDPDHEIQMATLLVAAMVRRFPRSVRVQMLGNVVALLAERPTELETKVANAGEAESSRRFRGRVSRLVKSETT